MRLRWWEAKFGIVPAALAILFFLAHEWVSGVVLLALVTFAAASRARIVERNIAGSHARTKAMLLSLRAMSLVAIYLVLTFGLWIMQQEGWGHETRGRVALYASAALAFYLARDIWRYGTESIDWLHGSEAEERVGAELDLLREEGWLVIHNLKPDGRGNIDHYVKSPRTAFAIETKSGKYRATDRGQAIGNAVWAKQEFRERWVTPVLCVGHDPPSDPREEPHGNSSVWVMGIDQLRPWLIEHRETPPGWRGRGDYSPNSRSAHSRQKKYSLDSSSSSG
jgi:hypothetical protein